MVRGRAIATELVVAAHVIAAGLDEKGCTVPGWSFGASYNIQR